jgi:hypothetical protein
MRLAWNFAPVCKHGDIGLQKPRRLRRGSLLLWHQKLWWMIPMFIVFFGTGLLLVFAQGSAQAPFIYALF